jgi:predicted lipoprotein with Yx(FWY)xxD motif
MKGRQEMARQTGRVQLKSGSRLAGGILATVALGAGSVAVATLPFSSNASASVKRTAAVKTLVLKKEHVAKIGTVLATSSGRTLYRWTVDPAGKATCTGACAKVWPPLLLPKGVTRVKGPSGVTGLSVARVAGGKMQVFFHHEALYGFVQDTKKGEATGQGVEGTWFAVLADGKSSAPHAAPTTASGSATATTVVPGSSSTKASSTSGTTKASGTSSMGTSTATSTPSTTKSSSPPATTTPATTSPGTTTPATTPPTTTPVTTPTPTTTPVTSRPTTTTTTVPPGGGVAY